MIGQNLLCDDSHIWHALVALCMEKKYYFAFFVVDFFSHFFTSSIGLQIRVRIVKLFFFYFSSKTYVVGTQKNRLIETVLLSTQTQFKLMGKKLFTILR